LGFAKNKSQDLKEPVNHLVTLNFFVFFKTVDGCT